MNAPYNIGIVGLGVMGQRMLARLAVHPLLRATWVWDANPQAVARTLATYPQLRAADSAQALIAEPGLQSLYIATPPAPHMALANQGFDAGLAVLCKKPLTVDFDAARRTIDRIHAQGQRAAVNFSLASSTGLAALQAAVQQPEGSVLGRPLAARVELAFAAWPRPWQAAAGAWLAQRAEGGFSREVLSHFIFVLQRVLGTATVLSSFPTYPSDGQAAETALRAQLQAGGVAIEVQAAVTGTLDDYNRLTLQGSSGEIELRDWFGAFQRSQPGDWQSLGDAAQMRALGQDAQLTQWLALIEGRAHTLPGFAEALAVQETIERLLAGV